MEIKHIYTRIGGTIARGRLACGFRRRGAQFYLCPAGKIEERERRADAADPPRPPNYGRSTEADRRAIRNQLIIGIIKLSAFTCSPRARAINAER